MLHRSSEIRVGQSFKIPHVSEHAVHLIFLRVMFADYLVENMVEVTKPVQLEGQQSCLYEVLVADEVAELLLILDSL